MNVLVLSHMYPSEVNPTAGIFVHEQVLALRALGHDVRVVAPVGWAPPGTRRWPAHRRVPGMVRRDGVPVLHPRQVLLPGASLGRLAAPAMLAALAGPVRRIHRRWPVDVLHAHMVWPDGWVAARLGAALGVPTVATAHRADVLDLPARSDRWRATVAGAVGAVDQVVSVSRAIGRAAEALGRPRRPVRVVPNGADPGIFAPRDPAVARARLGLPGGEPIVTYVGRLSRRKGVDTLVEAMGILGRRPTGAPLLAMVGEGAAGGAGRARAGPGGRGPDPLRRQGAPRRGAVVDGGGRRLRAGEPQRGPADRGLRGHGRGRPVVATAVDGTPEIVDHGHTGRLVPPGDPPALAEALGRWSTPLSFASAWAPSLTPAPSPGSAMPGRWWTSTPICARQACPAGPGSRRRTGPA